MKFCKGQSGLDYMLSHAWVVVVVVVAAIIFVNMGVLSFGGCERLSTGFSLVVPSDWEVYPKEGSVALTVENWAGDSVEISGINVSFNDFLCTGALTGTIIDPGESKPVMINCPAGAQKLADHIYPGSCYLGRIHISFVYPSGESGRSSGIIRGWSSS